MTNHHNDGWTKRAVVQCSHRVASLLLLTLALMGSAFGTPLEISSDKSCWYGLTNYLGSGVPSLPTATLLRSSETREHPSPVSTPIRHGVPFDDEPILFGYAPQFYPKTPVSTPLETLVILTDDFELQYLMPNGAWQSKDLKPSFLDALKASGLTSKSSTIEEISAFHATKRRPSQLSFDKSCGMYVLLEGQRDTSIGQLVLLFSTDGGHFWTASKIATINTVVETADLEYPSGTTSVLDGPPTLIVYHIGQSPCEAGMHISRCEYPTRLIVLARNGNDLIAQPALNISDHTVSAAAHSGGSHRAITDGDIVHLVYPGSRFPEYIPLPTNKAGRLAGTPAYYSSYNKITRRWTVKDLYLGYTTTSHGDILDNHNQVFLSLDEMGYLHFIQGGHHAPFHYKRSRTPHTLEDGFAIDEYISSSRGRGYSYPSLDIDHGGNVHVVARWADERYRFNLVHLIRTPTIGWAKFADVSGGFIEPHERLIVPAHINYNIWYHHTRLDTSSNLWVNYSFNPDIMTANEFSKYQDRYGEVDIKPTGCRGEGATQVCNYLAMPPRSPGLLKMRALDGKWTLATTQDFFLKCLFAASCP